MLKLYKHQQDLKDIDPKKTGIFWGTGSSKTIMALLLAQGKTLVICPKTLRDEKTWERNLEKLGKELDLTVLSKEDFRRDADELPAFDTVICDEAHTLLGLTTSIRYVKKQPRIKTSQLFEALESYLTRHPPERLYLLTATPTKTPMCVYGAAKLLGHNINFYEFRQEFYYKLNIPMREIYTAKKDDKSKEKLAELVRKIGYVGRLQDYFDVPEQTFKDVYVDLTAAQKKRLKELPLEYPEPIVLLGKKLQVENGILAGDEYNAEEVFENGKIDAVVEYAEEFPQMVIFCKYRLQIEQIKKALEKVGKRVYTMTGDTKDRGELLAEVNACKDYVFIVSAQISAGWELPECPVMVFASRTYSVVDFVQAQGRILRSNALKRNLYINLITKGNTIDNAVHEALVNKTDFNEKIYVEKGSKL